MLITIPHVVLKSIGRRCDVDVRSPNPQSAGLGSIGSYGGDDGKRGNDSLWWLRSRTARQTSRYIPSDDAYGHNTFQVLGSRLKPGCAENAIVNGELDLMTESMKQR
jgi:hypothetical protein